MPDLYVNNAGANSKVKELYVNYNGATTKVKELHESNGSAWTKIFSGNPAWTTNVTYFIEGNPTYLNYSIAVTGTTGWVDTMYFEFTEPIYINSLTMTLKCYPQVGTGSTSYRYKYGDGTESTDLISTVAIKRITVKAGWVDSASSQTISVQGYQQVVSRDFDTFYLNQTGNII